MPINMPKPEQNPIQRRMNSPGGRLAMTVGGAAGGNPGMMMGGLTGGGGSGGHSLSPQPLNGASQMRQREEEMDWMFQVDDARKALEQAPPEIRDAYAPVFAQASAYYENPMWRRYARTGGYGIA